MKHAFCLGKGLHVGRAALQADWRWSGLTDAGQGKGRVLSGACTLSSRHTLVEAMVPAAHSASRLSGALHKATRALRSAKWRYDIRVCPVAASRLKAIQAPSRAGTPIICRAARAHERMIA